MPRTYARIPVTITATGRYQCESCGQRFDRVEASKYASRPPRFCSTDCEKWRVVPCSVCETPVRKMAGSATSRRPVCSLMCRYFVTNGRWQSQPWTPPPAAPTRRDVAEHQLALAAKGRLGYTWYVGRCRECGDWFTSPQPNNVTCSSRCQKVAAKYRRRARQRDAFVAPVYRLAIYERDRWTCQLCGKKVKRNAVTPHPLAPTIDHIIPLGGGNGGTHEPSNCQLAHFICNARKSAGGEGEQLLLIG